MGYTPPPEVSAGLGASSTYDESTWNTYIRDNMEFVFAPNAASFGFYNPQTWNAAVGSFSFVPPIISYQWVGVGFDWPYVNSQVGLEANTQYLVHCGFSWSVTAGAISEVGVEVISGTAPTLGGAFTFDSVGAVAYDRGGTGYPSAGLFNGTIAATGSFVSSSSNPAASLSICATGVVAPTLRFDDVYLSFKKLKQA